MNFVVIRRHTDGERNVLSHMSEGLCTFSTPNILESMIVVDQCQAFGEMTGLFATDYTFVKS